MENSNGNYIVIFHDGTSNEIIKKSKEEVLAMGGKIGHEYDEVMLGYSATIPDSHIESLVKNQHIKFVEADGQVSIYGQQVLKATNLTK